MRPKMSERGTADAKAQQCVCSDMSALAHVYLQGIYQLLLPVLIHLMIFGHKGIDRCFYYIGTYLIGNFARLGGEAEYGEHNCNGEQPENASNCEAFF